MNQFRKYLHRAVISSKHSMIRRFVSRVKLRLCSRMIARDINSNRAYTKCVAVIYRRRSQNYERFEKSVVVFRQYIPKLLQEKNQVTRIIAGDKFCSRHTCECLHHGHKRRLRSYDNLLPDIVPRLQLSCPQTCA